MAVHIVQLGSPRAAGEGVRLGTVRRPPRGVPKADYAVRDFYDQWLPELSPSAELVATAQAADSDRAWAAFERKFRSEMKQPAPSRLLALLALLSHSTDFAVGCYCEDEQRCHRSVLRALLAEHGAAMAR